MVFALYIDNSLVKLHIFARDIKTALLQIPEMDNPEIHLAETETDLQSANQTIDGQYYELKEFVYTITYRFFTSERIRTVEYIELIYANYWYERYCKDPNYSSITKNW